MAVTRTLLCDDCGGTFPWLFMVEDDFPNHCPRCGAGMDDDAAVVPGAPAILTAKGKSVDQVYREIERTSEVRAEAAGDPSIKVTNMKDGLREGDIAAMPPQPSKLYQQEVAAVADAGGGGFSHWQANPMGASTQDLVALAKSGAGQGTGAPALRAIQSANGGGRPMGGGGSVAGIKSGFGGVG